MQQMQQLATDEGIDLDQLAHIIARIVATPNPALRYPVGGLARFMPFIKHMLPQRWFEAFIMRRFGASI
jgi:hypothetical protein